MYVKMELKRESSCFPTLAMWIRVLVLLASVVDMSMGDLNAISEMVSPGNVVRFKANSSSFKIAIFADLHYGENAWEAWGPQQDVKSTAVQSFLLDHHLPGVGPDEPIETTSRAELMEFDARLPSSFSKAGPKTLWPSVSNFVIPITSPDGTETVAIMYFLDSGGGSMAESISADQVAWFTTTASMINPGASIPELVFWHIPSIAYTQAGPEANQPIKAPCVGSINDESIASQETEWGIMNALASRNSVKAVFVGHNHGLDWCCPYHNFHLCFARHTGYGGYGTWKRGARFVEILLEPAYQIKTYVSLEDGTLVSDMLLN